MVQRHELDISPEPNGGDSVADGPGNPSGLNEEGNGEPDFNPTADFQSIEFRGKATEYFGIWISNLILSICTLGIYGAWAKVRRMKYFLNNTSMNRFSFSYHATGKQLLVGRLIAYAVIIIYSITSAYFLLASVVVLLLFVFLLPWLINKSMKFNARMTSWRNVRFNWHGTYWKTFFFFVVGPLLSVISVGILLPFLSKYYYQYYAQGHSFGTTRFDADSKLSKYFSAFLLVVLVPGIIAFIAIYQITVELVSGISLEEVEPLYFLLVLTIFALLGIYQTICRNILVRTITLGEAISFDSKLNPLVFLWISLSNFLLVIISVGFLAPWAAVRRYRYLANKTLYRIEPAAKEFLDEELEKMSSFGEEFAELEGIEISI